MITMLNKFSKGFMLGLILWIFFISIYIIYDQNKATKKTHIQKNLNHLIEKTNYL